MVELYTDINSYKIKNWKERSKKRTDLEKCVKEAKVRIGLQCHLRKRKLCRFELDPSDLNVGPF